MVRRFSRMNAELPLCASVSLVRFKKLQPVDRALTRDESSFRTFFVGIERKSRDGRFSLDWKALSPNNIHI